MTETKLTKQSEAILLKLQEDVQRHRLSEEELAQVRRGLAMVESLGVLGNVIIKAAAIIAAAGLLWQSVPWKGGHQ